MKYEEPSRITREKAEEIAIGPDTDDICRALVSISYHEKDLQWATNFCLKLYDHFNSDVRKYVLISLCNIVRIHNNIDLDTVMPFVNIMKTDPELHAYVEDFFEYVQLFHYYKNLN